MLGPNALAFWSSRKKFNNIGHQESLNANCVGTTRESHWEGRLSTVHLLIEISSFEKMFVSMKSSWSELVSTRRSTVLIVTVSVRTPWDNNFKYSRGKKIRNKFGGKKTRLLSKWWRIKIVIDSKIFEKKTFWDQFNPKNFSFPQKNEC